MSLEANKAMVRLICDEVFNQGNLAVAEVCVPPITWNTFLDCRQVWRGSDTSSPCSVPPFPICMSPLRT